jgi:HD-like signal output (HDOD) protein
MFNLDELDDFSSTLARIYNLLDETIDLLDDTHYHAQINGLFREIHSLKAKAYYFEFDEISSVCDKAEDIFTFLINHKCTLTESLALWLDILTEQIHVWYDELKDYETGEINLSHYTEELDFAPQVKVADYEIDKINTHRVIVLQKDKQTLDILEKILPAKFEFISSISSVKEAKTILEKSRESKILISDIKFDDGDITELVKEKLLKDTKVIVLSKLKQDQIEKVKTIMKTPYVYDYLTTKISEIKQDCIDIALPDENELITIPMDSSKMSLEQLAASIKPLSGIMMQVKNACFDEETTYGEIAEIIEADPALSIKLLRKINSPYYGLKKQVSNIKHGIMMIGKKQLSAIILSELSKEMIVDVNVDMYNTDIDEMMTINRLRSNLMKEWLKYEKGFGSDVIDDVNTISILTIVGTFLTATAIDYNIQDKKFKSLINGSDIQAIETKLLGFNSYDVAEKVFNAWGFPPLFSQVSNKLNSKLFSDGAIGKYAFAIYILHKIFRVDGEIHLTKNILEEAKKNGFDYKNLLSVYKNVVGEKYNTTIAEYKEQNGLK